MATKRITDIEFAEISRISRKKIRQYCRTGIIPCDKDGHIYYMIEEDADLAVKNHCETRPAAKNKKTCKPQISNRRRKEEVANLLSYRERLGVI